MNSLALLGLAATLATAQVFDNQTAPFTLKITDADAANATLNGFSTGACHNGAASEAACVGQPPGPDDYFFLNYTSGDRGLLIYNLPAFGPDNTRINVSSPMQLDWNVQSNVAPMRFTPGARAQYVGFDADNKMYLADGYDDSNFPVGPQRPDPFEVGLPAYQWYACWNYFLSYYYFSIAWVSTGTPSNPTCQGPFNITRTFV